MTYVNSNTIGKKNDGHKAIEYWWSSLGTLVKNPKIASVVTTLKSVLLAQFKNKERNLANLFLFHSDMPAFYVAAWFPPSICKFEFLT